MAAITILRLPHNAIPVESNMPYQALVNRLRRQLDKENDREKREDIEVRIIVLIGIMDLKRSVDKMVQQLRNISE